MAGRRRGGGLARVIGALLALVVLFVGCAPQEQGRNASPETSTTLRPSTTTSTALTTTTSAPPTTTVPPPPPPLSARDRLAVLVVDDRPSPVGTYRREDWPHWSDTDRNGCDARQDALIAWSTVPATVNRSGTCRVVAGSWTSPYDGRTTNNPSDVDVDHLVPLENAFRAGGWTWTAAQRRLFANDPAELVVTSASSNRSKGSKTPDQWRPPDRLSWCAYADGWVSVKQNWSLTVTTSERDALGQMLDTCGIAGPVWPGRP